MFHKGCSYCVCVYSHELYIVSSLFIYVDMSVCYRCEVGKVR